MKIIVSYLFFIALPLFAQQTVNAPAKPPYHQITPASSPEAQAAAKEASPGNLPPHHEGPAPQFTEAEQALAGDISQKQTKLQAEIDDFLRIVRMDHPGYEFRGGLTGGTLVPIQPPAPPKPAEKK
jgi:hypothetical protein